MGSVPLLREEKLMRRRELIGFVVPLAVWPAIGFSQTLGRQQRIGFLGTWGESDVDGAKRLDKVRVRLRELGWTEGKNLQIDARFGDNDGEGIRKGATELIKLAPDAIISTTSTTTRALMNAGGNIPIVAAVSGDPICIGFHEKPVSSDSKHNGLHYVQ